MKTSGIIFVLSALSIAGTASGQTVVTKGVGSANSFKANSTLGYGGSNSFNWSDLPFTLNLGQSFGYNSNVLGLPNEEPFVAPNTSRGDFFSTTTIGISAKANISAQHFFVDGTYGFTKYHTDIADNTDQYSFDGGVDWNVTRRCTGRLIAAANQYQSPISEQVGPGINSVTANSFNETGKCLLTGYISAIFDSGLSSTANSDFLDAFNNYRSEFVRGGFEYELSGLDTLRVLATLTDRQFTGRNGVTDPAAGLAASAQQADYQIEYHRAISPKLAFDGMIGLSDYAAVPILAGSPKDRQSSPIYSVSMTWQATPKLSFSIAGSQSVGAPANVLSNFQFTKTLNGTLNYQATPRIGMQAGIARTYWDSPALNGAGISAANSGNGFDAFYDASYAITPFVNATAQYTYSDRFQANQETKGSTLTFGLSFRPH